jgi:predicted transcriptional regulator
MADSLAEYVRQDMSCEGLLECFHGLGRPERNCYQVVVDAEEPLTVDEIADQVGRERSTIYRSIQRLLQAGLVQKEQINYDDGGYYHVYKPRDPDKVTDEMQRLLNDWYATMGQLIRAFEDEYGDRIDPQPTADG